MSNEVREMLATLLDNIYGNWLETISSTHGNSSKSVLHVLRENVIAEFALQGRKKKKSRDLLIQGSTRLPDSRKKVG